MRDDEMPLKHPGKLLRELLAVIHRDGGHHAASHGPDESTRQAIEAVTRLHQVWDGTRPTIDRIEF